MPPKFFENIAILCFERRFSKQNSVIRLKSNILPPPPIFRLDVWRLAIRALRFYCVICFEYVLGSGSCGLESSIEDNSLNRKPCCV